MKNISLKMTMAMILTVAATTGARAQFLSGSATATDKRVITALSAIPAIPKEEQAPVLAIGDSMMRLLGNELEKTFKKYNIEASAHASLGTGLARLDAYDWREKAVSLMSATKAQVVIATFGANDSQVMLDGAGQKLLVNTPEWNAEYGNRVGAIMDLLIAGGAKRVIWMTLPYMKATALQENAEKINAIFAKEVAKRAGKVILFETSPILAGQVQVGGTPPTLTVRNKKFSSYVMSSAGTPVVVRDPDGVHLTTDGARRMAEALAFAYWKPQLDKQEK